jgi:FO synthase
VYQGSRFDVSVVTYIPEFQVILTRRCVYACGYCSYPNTPALLPPSKKQMLRVLRTAGRLQALQITLTSGEGVEGLPEITSVIRYYGFNSWCDYVRAQCDFILQRNGRTLFFPQVDIGPLSYTDVRRMKPVLSIARLMLNSADNSLLDTVAHRYAPQKALNRRLSALEELGVARIPTVTGITVGIGESPKSWGNAAECVSALNRRYGNILSFEMEPFYPQRFSVMENRAPVSDELFLQAVSDVRSCLDSSITLSVRLQDRLHLVPEVVEKGATDIGPVCLGSSEHIHFETQASLSQAKDRFQAEGLSLVPRIPFDSSFLRRCPLPVSVQANVDRYRDLRPEPSVETHGKQH